jgi:hypothetical protein
MDRIITIGLIAAALMAVLAGARLAAAEEPILCNGRVATIVSHQPGATVYGTGGPDVILATGEGARVYGLGGNDIVCAPHGRAFGGSGDDVVIGDVAHGDSGDDYLTAQDGRGDSGDDVVIASLSAYGGSGNDRLVGAGEVCDGGSGIDSAEDCPFQVNIP